MNYTKNAIYTKLREAVLSVDSNAYVTGQFVPQPPKFPCVYIRQLDCSRTRQGFQLDGEDVQNEVTFEVQIISNLVSGRSEEAYKLLNAVDTAMRNMFFREISLSPFDDGEKTILAARFQRVIGGGDVMPT